MTGSTDDIAQTAPPLIPSHGNGVLRPWQPGQSGNPSGTPKATRAALRLAKAAAPDAMRLLIAMMNDPAEDSRARLVAAAHVLDRAMGKPKEAPPDDDGGEKVDLSSLSAEQRDELGAALDTIKRLTGRGLGPVPLVQVYLPDNGRGGA